MALTHNSERRCCVNSAPTFPCPRRAKLTLSVSSINSVIVSSEGVFELCDGYRRGPFDVLAQRAKAGKELLRPLIDWFKDHTPSYPTDEYLALSIREAAIAREAHG